VRHIEHITYTQRLWYSQVAAPVSGSPFSVLIYFSACGHRKRQQEQQPSSSINTKRKPKRESPAAFSNERSCTAQQQTNCKMRLFPCRNEMWAKQIENALKPKAKDFSIMTAQVCKKHNLRRWRKNSLKVNKYLKNKQL